jgi:hypothetical protein
MTALNPMVRVPIVSTDSSAPTAAPSTGGVTGADLEHVVFWGGGIAVLLIVTDHWPRAGLALTGLIVASVLLPFSSQIATWIQDATKSSTTGGAPAKGVNSSGTGTARVVALPRNTFVRAAIRRA